MIFRRQFGPFISDFGNRSRVTFICSSRLFRFRENQRSVFSDFRNTIPSKADIHWRAVMSALCHRTADRLGQPCSHRDRLPGYLKRAVKDTISSRWVMVVASEMTLIPAPGSRPSAAIICSISCLLRTGTAIALTPNRSAAASKAGRVHSERRRGQS